MTNKYLEKVASKLDALKAGARNFAHTLKGTEAKDLKGMLKRTPIDREHLAARMDLGKKLQGAQRKTLAARAGVGAGAAAVAGGAAAATREKSAQIHIDPAHKGLLHKKMGVSGDKKIGSGALAAEKAKAKASGNTKLEKEVVFAQNAKKWNHK